MENKMDKKTLEYFLHQKFLRELATNIPDRIESVWNLYSLYIIRNKQYEKKIDKESFNSNKKLYEEWNKNNLLNKFKGGGKWQQKID